MKCPHCNFIQADHNTECLKCGIIFEKYQKQPGSYVTKIDRSVIERKVTAKDGNVFPKIIFFVEPGVNPFYFGGRVLIFLIVFAWGWKFILTPMESNDVGSSFLHLVNLPFHEAGHIFFQLFGRWMTSLGGTLGQLMIPLICLFVLLIESRDPFGASTALWWLGESFMDVAPYMNDARNQELPLIGGITGKEADYGYHDWEYILNEIGLIRYDHLLAHMADKLGAFLMFVSFAWGGYILFKQYKNLDTTLKD